MKDKPSRKDTKKIKKRTDENVTNKESKSKKRDMRYVKQKIKNEIFTLYV